MFSPIASLADETSQFGSRRLETGSANTRNRVITRGAACLNNGDNDSTVVRIESTSMEDAASRCFAERSIQRAVECRDTRIFRLTASYCIILYPWPFVVAGFRVADDSVRVEPVINRPRVILLGDSAISKVHGCLRAKVSRRSMQEF